MRNMLRTSLLTLLLFFPCGHAAAQVCSSADGHAAERICLEAKATESTKLVALKEKQLLSAIAAWGDGADSQQKATSNRLARESSERFKEFRHSQCELYASTAAGGNGAGDMRAICVTKLNQDRMQSLVEQISLFK
jgi:hypothetical protein